MPPKQELSNDTVIDISHESLIRQWETLRSWVDEESESSKIFLRLAESTQQYHQNKKDLLFGLELDQYIEWREHFKPNHSWAKRYSADCDRCLKYLEDSEKQRARIEEENRKQLAERELRRRKELKRAKVFASVLALATLVSIGFLIYASYQRKQALIQRDIAQANYQISEAQLQAGEDPTIALRMAEQAIQIQSSPLVLNAAHQIYRENVFYKTIAHDHEVNAVAFSPESTLMVTGCQDGIVQVWNTNGEVQLEIPTGQAVNAVAFAPSVDQILIAKNEGAVILYNLEGDLIMEFKHEQSVSSVAFSPNGNYLLTGSEQARIWDMKGNLLSTFGHGQISSVAFSPDGQYVLTAYYDKHAELWDLNGNIIREFGDISDYIYCVSFSPDGKRILTGSVDGIAKIWDISGRLIEEFDFHTNRISSVAFSPT
jgi:cell division protein FtsL